MSGLLCRLGLHRWQHVREWGRTPFTVVRVCKRPRCTAERGWL